MIEKLKTAIASVFGGSVVPQAITPVLSIKVIHVDFRGSRVESIVSARQLMKYVKMDKTYFCGFYRKADGTVIEKMTPTVGSMVTEEQVIDLFAKGIL